MTVWLISGCSSGFGKILAQQLLHAPSTQVVATARNSAALDDLPNTPNVLKLTLDVSCAQSIAAAVRDTVAHFGKIDVLVNNAGYGIVGALEETPLAQTRALFDTNVFGLMALTQAVLPHMRARQRGHIINMSSVAGVVPMAGFSSYNASKYAVEGISQALALELAPFNISVTAIEPGPFRTDFAGRSLQVMPTMSAYAQGAAAQTRQYFEQTNGQQQGDPVRAAQIIQHVVTMPNPPTQLALGSIAVQRIAQALQQQQNSVQQYATLSNSANYADA